jgi:hypothetical protein
MDLALERGARVRALGAENARLKAELVAARKDTARLDWLIANDCSITDTEVYTGIKPWKHGVEPAGMGSNARAAIDAAVKEGE